MSNYEITKQKSQELFLEYNQENMIEKWKLKSDENYIYLKFFDRNHRINRKNGLVEYEDIQSKKWIESGFNESMTIYDLLCYSKENCCISGEFILMNQLSKVQNATSYAGKGMFYKEELLFDTKKEQLSFACEKLDGTKEGKGDVSYKIPVFADLSVLLQFWSSDEEFPASLRIFCDKNMLDYMHYETIWYMVCYFLERLKENMI